MFLRHVSVRNFRGIVRLELDLDDTTILIGENNVGKTSFLELLDICLGHGDGEAFAFELGDFHVCPADAPRPPLPIEVTLTFAEREKGEWQAINRLSPAFVNAGGGRHEVALKIEARPAAPLGDMASFEDGARLDLECTFLDGDGKPLEPQPGADAVGEVRRLNAFILVRADRYFLERSPKSDDTAPHADLPDNRQGRLEKEIERVYAAVISSEAPLPVAELRRGLAAVGQLLGDRADALFRSPDKPQRILEELVQHPVALAIDSGPRLETRLQGAGVQSVALLVLLGALLEARGPESISPDAELIVAIEEPEVHLHPLMLAAVWGVIDGLRAQKLVTTNAGELLAAARLSYLRRLVRGPKGTNAYRVDDEKYSLEEIRKISYHIRLKRDDALFARCWLLVEGETELWLLPEMARLLGCDFATEGIHTVEFAQSGVEPLVKLANDLGLEWHLVADGDEAGKTFAAVARAHAGGAALNDRVTLLQQPDMEHCLWHCGYDYVYHSIARGRTTISRTSGKKSRKNPRRVIAQAVSNTSKPHLALAVVEQATEADSPGVPDVLRTAIETAVRLARAAAAGERT